MLKVLLLILLCIRWISATEEVLLIAGNPPTDGKIVYGAVHCLYRCSYLGIPAQRSKVFFVDQIVLNNIYPSVVEYFSIGNYLYELAIPLESYPLIPEIGCNIFTGGYAAFADVIPVKGAVVEKVFSNENINFKTIMGKDLNGQIINIKIAAYYFKNHILDEGPDPIHDGDGDKLPYSINLHSRAFLDKQLSKQGGNLSSREKWLNKLLYSLAVKYDKSWKSFGKHILKKKERLFDKRGAKFIQNYIIKNSE